MTKVTSSIGLFPLLATTATTITSEQVKSLRANPITIISSPPPGTLIYFLGAQSKYVYGGSSAFTNVKDLALQISGGPTTISSNIDGLGFLNQTESLYQLCFQQGNPKMSIANTEGRELVLKNVGGSEITGNPENDNSLVITVYYSILTL